MKRGDENDFFEKIIFIPPLHFLFTEKNQDFKNRPL